MPKYRFIYCSTIMIKEKYSIGLTYLCMLFIFMGCRSSPSKCECLANTSLSNSIVLEVSQDFGNQLNQHSSSLVDQEISLRLAASYAKYYLYLRNVVNKEEGVAPNWPNPIAGKLPGQASYNGSLIYADGTRIDFFSYLKDCDFSLHLSSNGIIICRSILQSHKQGNIQSPRVWLDIERHIDDNAIDDELILLLQEGQKGVSSKNSADVE